VSKGGNTKFEKIKFCEVFQGAKRGFIVRSSVNKKWDFPKKNVNVKGGSLSKNPPGKFGQPRRILSREGRQLCKKKKVKKQLSGKGWSCGDRKRLVNGVFVSCGSKWS